MKPKSNTRDYSKSIFNGVVYNKGRLVHAVVKQYIKDFPEISFRELERTFPREIQRSYGVIAKFDDAKLIEHSSGQTRHYLKDQELLTLKDGTQVAVCTQWAAELNFERFLKRAESLGYLIKKFED